MPARVPLWASLNIPRLYMEKKMPARSVKNTRFHNLFVVQYLTYFSKARELSVALSGDIWMQTQIGSWVRGDAPVPMKHLKGVCMILDIPINDARKALVHDYEVSLRKWL